MLSRVRPLLPHRLWPARLLCPWDFSRQEYWSGLPFPSPGDLPIPGLEPWSPALQADSLPTEIPVKWIPVRVEWSASFFHLSLLFVYGTMFRFYSGNSKVCKTHDALSKYCLLKCKSDLELGEWLSLIWCWRLWAISRSRLLGCSEIKLQVYSIWYFPGSSVGKESACKAGDPGSIPGLGRSSGEGIGYPLQYSWTSLVAQLVKNCLQCGRSGFDPWVGKMPWRRERLPTPVFWPRKFHGLYSPWGHKESDTMERLSLYTLFVILIVPL